MSDQRPSGCLDPEDWGEFRALAHRAVDEAIDQLASVRTRPVWQPMPDALLDEFRRPLPREPQSPESVYEDFKRCVVPYPMGNTHPRFWAWYMGAGTPVGALGDFLASMLNPNMGGGNHGANHVEAQVVDWCKDIVGLPRASGGLLVSGGSMANLVGLAVARNATAGIDVRADGVQSLRARTTWYASVEVHSSVQKALELMGLGARALRKVPVDRDYRIDPGALAQRIAADRAAGLQPCCVVGTAGTINTGAVDDLSAIADICERERLWFHVDGAIGAVLRLSSRHRGLVAGIERADSVALDLHKWLQVPFEAGCALVRDRQLHRGTFALTPEYLEHAERGIASGHLWFSEYGIQLSRSFRALKVWWSFKEHGTDRYAALIDRTIEQAHELARLIEAADDLELMAPVVTNIVCFRYRPDGGDEASLNALNEELMVRLHESGLAAPSYTTLAGRYCLRAALANHRTRDDDLPLVVDAVRRIGRELCERI
jgi:glutamate/tyrosine decarboxylase-like PLP-dependent enzyme